jgi:hypothetical protein
MASQQAAAVAADIMQVQAAGANPAGLQAAAKHFEQVVISDLTCRLPHVMIHK